MRVPKPTRNPASATQPRPKPWRMGAGPAKACQGEAGDDEPGDEPGAPEPVARASSGRAPCGPGEQAVQDAADARDAAVGTSSHTLARPIRTPPITAGRGVKFSIVMVFRQLFDPQSS